MQRIPLETGSNDISLNDVAPKLDRLDRLQSMFKELEALDKQLSRHTVRVNRALERFTALKEGIPVDDEAALNRVESYINDSKLKVKEAALLKDRVRVKELEIQGKKVFELQAKVSDQEEANFLSAYINNGKVNDVTTHTSPAGGSYHVAHEGYRRDFLAKYLHAFLSNEPLYLTELVTKSDLFCWAVFTALDSWGLSHLKHQVRLSAHASKIHVHIPGLVVLRECARAFLAVVKNIIESEALKSELLTLLGRDNLDKVFDPSTSLGYACWEVASWLPRTRTQHGPLTSFTRGWTLILSIFNLAEDNVTRIAPPVTAVSSEAERLSAPPNDETHSLLTNQDHLDVLKAGLGTVLMYRPEEFPSFKKYAKSVVVKLDDTWIEAQAFQQSRLPAATVGTAIGVFPVEFRDLIQNLFQELSEQNEEQLVSDTIANERFQHRNDYFPGTAAHECVRKDNKLVSRVVNDTAGDLDLLLRGRHNHCNGVQFARTSNEGLEFICDACTFRYPSKESFFLPIVRDSYKSLYQFLVQVNPTKNITINNYNVESSHLDVQFNKVEPMFPDGDLNLAMFRSSTSDIGSLVYEAGKNLFAVAQSASDPWWAFNPKTGRWSQSITEIRHFCKTTVAVLFYTANQWYVDNTADLKLSRDSSIRFENIIKRLKDKDLSYVLQMATDDFIRNRPEFLTKLDTKKDLIAFPDGVYDLTKGEFCSASPDDYITLCTGYAYPGEADPEFQSKIMAFV
ncbi:hypothetical protein HDU78_005238 [Chytriomyces hyalinus]|nr:hypothetical protein HDU78_005238 [Chytriomyces hyalinus]